MFSIRKQRFLEVQFSSVAQSCPTPSSPMNHSTPGLPVHHQLPEFTQTHVHQVGVAIQPSHPLSSPSPPAPSVISATSLVSTPNPISGKATVSGQLYHRFISLSFLWSRIFLEGLQFSSVAQSCPTLCDPMNRSTQGLPVHHRLPEFTQTRVHQVRDAIQPSHPLSSPSPPAPNPS